MNPIIESAHDLFAAAGHAAIIGLFVSLAVVALWGLATKGRGF